MNENNLRELIAKSLLKHLYSAQRSLSEAELRAGLAGQIDLVSIGRVLRADSSDVIDAAFWARRRGYLAEPAIDQWTLENGGMYITDKGARYVEDGFDDHRAKANVVNIQDSTVYGNVVASSRDAFVIASPVFAGAQAEIKNALANIQKELENLAPDSDYRYDGLQQLDTIQRELAKEQPESNRLERALAALGSLASVSVAILPHFTTLKDLLGKVL